MHSSSHDTESATDIMLTFRFSQKQRHLGELNKVRRCQCQEMCLEDTTVLSVPHPRQGFSADFEPGSCLEVREGAPCCPQGSRLLVNFTSSPAWMPSGKVQPNTPKGALTQLQATWSFLPLSTSTGFPDSFPSRVLTLKAKHKLVAVSPPTQKCWNFHINLPEPASLPCSSPMGTDCPLRLLDTSAAPTLEASPQMLDPVTAQLPARDRSFSCSYDFVRPPTRIQICSVLKGLGVPCSVLKGPEYPVTKSQTKFTPNKKPSPFGRVKSTF